MPIRPLLSLAAGLLAWAMPLQACTLTSVRNPALVIQVQPVPGRAFSQGSLFQQGRKLASLGELSCSTGYGGCSFHGGSLGTLAVIGFRNGRPSRPQGADPSSYMINGLASALHSQSPALSAAAGDLWSRGSNCTERVWDFP